MKVYHGSSAAIDEIDISQCRPGRDFGRGFYVTALYRQAQMWAQRKGAEVQGKGVVTEYEFDEYAYDYDKLKVLRFDGYTDQWFDFIILNRSSMTRQAHDYDIVEGPIADDQITSRIYLYQEGKLTKEQFLEELKFKKPTHQICFCTPASLQMLTPVRKTADADIIQISEQIIKELITSDADADELRAANCWYRSATYTALSDETTGLYRRPWREVYDMLRKEINL
jgi:hypothetical protein